MLDFAFRLLNASASGPQQTNRTLSPLSVYVALALVWNGTRGETRREIGVLLGLPDGNDEAVAAIAALQGTAHAAAAAETAVANSLWLNGDMEFEQAFLALAREQFEAEIATMDFGDPGAVATVNRWVSDHTRGRIDSIISQLDPTMALVLINAVYFKGRWAAPFKAERTSDAPFYAPRGQRTCRMMAQRGPFAYANHDTFQIVRLPYEGGMSMLVLLPDEHDGLADLLASLNPTNWQTWVASLKRREGDVMLPRWTHEYELGLNKSLQALGMRQAFNHAHADLRGIATTTNNLYIDEVRHKTFVDVNEEGTEAAAVTAVMFRAAGFVPDRRFHFVADHPFLYAIVDQADQPWFLGVVAAP